ncbi:murein transglycosylase A [Sphingomonas sabuli]|uniref:peptidoglycan lytic exotransglycosylase n=1 Tax=Sphingomonas sabuli TaxID=2764186 RepID=A0A7G9L5M6_9SPHN|nr:murein transglycosylase A [Sphingomonas sabuli]QNM83925.1 murein transglycosylase A [Sphingomonas sabuli]
MNRLKGLALVSALLLSACATRPVDLPPAQLPPPTQPRAPVVPVEPPKPATAIQAGVVISQPAQLNEADAAEALAAFRISCPSVVSRADKSGLASPADWSGVCAQAALVPPGGASAFFHSAFDWVRVGDGKAFATGYFEPEIVGSPVPLPGYVPIHATPSDLTRCALPDGKTGRGRIDENGQCVYYFSRAEIEAGALNGRAPIIGYAADSIELFFLHIQGSGRLRYPDGRVVRIGYDNQNGREYVAIGKLLRERGILPAGGTSMDAIVGWMRANPEEGRALMHANPSYIFFKQLTGPGPLGALNRPVTAHATVAADPNFIPLGAPVWLGVDRPEAWGLWIAQDTGGAIKGANRVDTFWGAGEAARRTAGGMSAKGQALVLLPKGAVARALAQR